MEFDIRIRIRIRIQVYTFIRELKRTNRYRSIDKYLFLKNINDFYIVF